MRAAPLRTWKSRGQGYGLDLRSNPVVCWPPSVRDRFASGFGMKGIIVSTATRDGILGFQAGPTVGRWKKAVVVPLVNEGFSQLPATILLRGLQDTSAAAGCQKPSAEGPGSVRFAGLSTASAN